MIVAALVLGVLTQAGGALEREERVRLWALEPDRCAGELHTALTSGALPERWSALQALVRAQRAGLDFGPGVRVAITSAIQARSAALHPNVLTLALELDFVDLDPREHFDHPLPAVRRAALQRLLRELEDPSFVSDEELETRLLQACEDPAPGVVHAAEQALVRLDCWRYLESRDNFSPIFRACLAIERQGCDPELLDRWRSYVSVEGPFAGRTRARVRALVEALALLRIGEGDVGVLLDEMPNWTSDYRAFFRRAATRGGVPLADLALERAVQQNLSHELVGDHNNEDLELALAAGGADAVLAFARDRVNHPGNVLELLHVVRSDSERFDVSALAYWIDGRPQRVGFTPRTIGELRRLAVQILSDRVVVEGDPDAARELEKALAAPDPSARGIAFRALCSAPDPRPSIDALFAAWERADEEERGVWLGLFPRGPSWGPFLESWLELGETNPEERGAVAELCAGFKGNERAREVLAGWFEPEVAALARAIDDSQPGAVARTKKLGLALFAIDPESAAGPLESACQVLCEREEETGKSFVAVLGRTDEGLAAVGSVLSDAEALTRVRTEAALVLVPQGEETAVAWLCERFEHCDGELRARIVRAFGACSNAEALAFLTELAIDRDVSVETRVGATRALAARPDSQLAYRSLLRVLAETPDLDTVHAAVTALGSSADSEARADLLGLLEHIDLGSALPERAADWFRAAGGLDVALEIGELRGVILSALALGACAEDALGAAVLRAPLAAARGDLADRLRDRSSARVEFRWRGELALGSALARAGRLGAALDECERWWSMDGRFLDALAGVAVAEPETARRLTRGAMVALAGEPPSSRGRTVRFGARTRLIALAQEAGDWDEVVQLLVELERDWRSRSLSSSGERRLFGTYDARAGIDPGARLASAVEQAHARAALARADVQAAREHARRAEARLGLSIAAKAEQVKLLTELAELE